MINRLIDFFHRCKIKDGDVSPMWVDLVNLSHKPLLDALVARDEPKILNSLENFCPLGCAVGMGGPQSISWDSEHALSRMQNLAQRLGLLPIENELQKSPTDNWKLKSIADIRPAIEKELRFDLTLPNHAGMDCRWPEGGVPWSFPMYCSAAKSILECFGDPPQSILEIGAGLGNLGFISLKWKVCSYTVIDLPTVAVLSAWNISKVCGEEQIWLNGEPERETFARFYSSTDYAVAGTRKYNLIFNSDSLPEIPPEAQRGYLDLIASCLDKNGVFLSINHESDRIGQRRVYEAVKEHGKLRLASRRAFMMRDGYIEEYYVL